MEKLKLNPNNAKYYSEDFIKGFECGVERQFNADMVEKTAEWVNNKCSVCDKGIEDLIDSREWYENEKPNYCPFCGAKMEKSEENNGDY